MFPKGSPASLGLAQVYARSEEASGERMSLSSAMTTDALAFLAFLACWLGYDLAAKVLTRRRPNVITTINVFREQWMRRMCERENRVADAALLSNLLRGALFFASTTVLILGGLLAVLGTGSKVAEVVGTLPYVARTESWLLEVKAIILIMAFVYAFFKFTWSAWQYNILSIMVGAAPFAGPGAGNEAATRFASGAANIALLAGESYNNGMRAYYFSIPLITWFVDPRVFLAATLVVAFVLYKREFSSPMLRALRQAAGQ